MCNVCCKELQGWCRAFTATEVLLSILQAILLSLFVAFLTFLILHFIACTDIEITVTEPDALTVETSSWFTNQDRSSPSGIDSETEETILYSVSDTNNTLRSTVASDISCSWTPSAKTTSVTQYFEYADKSITVSNASERPPSTPLLYDEFLHTPEYDDGIFVSDQFDGEPASGKSFVMALVKMKSPDEITFGCILTVISEFWTLTAASCIESVEEIDTLDSFVMMENFGEQEDNRIHTVSDIHIHPQYQGTNKRHNVVALKSRDKLANKILLTLPTMLDYLLITIGERLTILGFGKFRSIERDALARGAHAVSVHVLPSAHCAARVRDAWSARHVTSSAEAARGFCEAGVCAGPLYARGAPCNYCAGTPLLQARVLLGLMSDPAPCGAPCEPAFMFNTGIVICSVLMAAFVVGALAVSALQLAAAAAGPSTALPALHDII